MLLGLWLRNVLHVGSNKRVIYGCGWLHPQLPHPPCHRWVTIVGELAEGVQNGQLGVGGGEEGQRQGDRTTDHRVAIVELVCAV